MYLRLHLELAPHIERLNSREDLDYACPATLENGLDTQKLKENRGLLNVTRQVIKSSIFFGSLQPRHLSSTIIIVNFIIRETNGENHFD